MRLARAAVLAALAGLTAAVWPASLSAHASLRAATPAAGSTLGAAPDRVALTFSEAPDLQLTSIKVLDRGGTDHVGGPVAAVAGSPATVAVALEELDDGVYTVTWRTVSAVDSHISAGTFVFGVGVAPPTGPPDQVTSGTGQSGSPAAIVARWVLYLGLIGLIGAAFAAIAVARRPEPDLLAMAALAWLLAALGTVGVVGVQWAETGAPIETLPSTSIGMAALLRLSTLASVGLALGALGAARRLPHLASWSLVGAASVFAVAADVVTGHAAAGSNAPLQVVSQVVHAVAAGSWVGGLAGLLLLLRSTPVDERAPAARRFSRWAGILLAVVAASGAFRAVAEVRTVEALLGTDYGRVVLGKTALLFGLAALGAFNRFISLRNAARFATGLRRVGATELGLAVTVLGLTALLVNLSPPASSAGQDASRPSAILALGSDFGTSMKARLIATPGPAGENRFDLALIDYDTSEPVTATAAELRFELASQAGVAPSSLELQSEAPGRFTATGANLSIDGIWRITATVTTPGGAVEIPLVTATTLAPQPVTSLVTPGLPTIHTVQLGSAGSAQVYLDPGVTGQNELHVTFFDPNGVELPVEAASIVVVPEGAGGLLPPTRLLGPGHFVATVDVVEGNLAVDAVAPVPTAHGGGQIHLHVIIEVSP